MTTYNTRRTPRRVVERYLRTTLGRYGSEYESASHPFEGVPLSAAETVLGRYANTRDETGTNLLFTDEAIYQVAGATVTRIAYDDVATVDSPDTEKSRLSSVTLSLHSGAKVRIPMDGGDATRDALQLHQFFVNLLAARARGATF